MIRGFCMGGGLGFALSCDIRICSDNSSFALPAAKLSLGYAFSGIKRLVDGRAPAERDFFKLANLTPLKRLPWTGQPRSAGAQLKA